jgi:hypothetical protein
VTTIYLNEQAKTKHNNKIQCDINKPDVTGETYKYEMFSCALVHPCQLSPELQSECCALCIPVCSQGTAERRPSVALGQRHLGRHRCIAGAKRGSLRHCIQAESNPEVPNSHPNYNFAFMECLMLDMPHEAFACAESVHCYSSCTV